MTELIEFLSQLDVHDLERLQSLINVWDDDMENTLQQELLLLVKPVLQYKRAAIEALKFHISSQLIDNNPT